MRSTSASGPSALGAHRGAHGAPAEPRRAHRDWRDAWLHASAARPAGLPRPPPARLLLDARARRDPLRGRARARRWRCRSARARSRVSTGTLDRQRTAAELGFARPSPNSIDAVSNRDFALDYLHAAAVCATHLSRLGSEVVLWSSQEFGFCHPADDFASGSSIMPQKKNPDAAELLRAKAPRVTASLTTLLGVLHALPLAYSQGPAGGQGGPLRRRRHDRAVAGGGRAHARRAALRSRADGGRRRGRDGGRDRHRGPAGPQGHAVPGGTRRRRRARAARRRVRAHALRADSRRARIELGPARRRLLRGRSATGPGSTRRSRPAARPRRASHEQLATADGGRRGARGASAFERYRRRVLRTLGPRRRSGPGGLLAAPSRASAG